MDADTLQADRVQHAGRRLDHARWRVSFPLRKKEPFRRDAAKSGDVERVGVLDAVPETAARSNERVFERQRANLNGQVHHLTAENAECTENVLYKTLRARRSRR